MKHLTLPSVMFPIMLFLFSLAVQLIYCWEGFDNQILNGFAPTRGDAGDYAGRTALLLEQGGFVRAFADGFRVPGYPFFMLPFLKLFAQPYLAMRIVQLVAMSLVPVFLYGAVRVQGVGRFSAFIAGALGALWLPLYYWTPVLMPEALSIVLLALLLVAVFRVHSPTRHYLALLPATLIMIALFYLKPNFVFIFVPLFGAFLYEQRGHTFFSKTTVLPLLVSAGVFALAVTPWTIFISLQNKTLVGLSTTQGTNLYIGTFASEMKDEDAAAGSLPERIAHRTGLIESELQRRRSGSPPPQQLSAGQLDKWYSKQYAAMWQRFPLPMVLVSAAKPLHMMGGSFRSKTDLFFFLFNAAAFLSALFVWVRHKHHRRLVLFYALSLVVCMAQAFFFLPNYRFKIATLDLQTILMVWLGTEVLVLKRFSAKGQGDVLR